MVKTLVALSLIILVVSFGSCVIHRSFVQTAADGQPFDHLGPRIKCQLCDAKVAVCSTGYNYRCETCGKEFRARWDAEMEEIQLDW